MNSPKVPVRVHFPVSQVPPHLRGKHLHLLYTPPERARKQRETHALGAPVEVLANPLPELLVALILGPRVDWPLDRRGDNVDETRAVHHVGHVSDGVEREASYARAFLHVGVPAEECGGGGERIVVAADDKVDVVDFEVPIWFEKSGGSG
jgi:CO/xanthine dehydrogenase Mo-binding subunit